MRENFVKSAPVQFALREMQRTVTSPLFWAVMMAVIVILTISGPFHTLEIFNTPKRFAYWGAIAVLTYFSNIFIANLVDQSLVPKLQNRWLRIFISGLVGSIFVTLIVWSISAFIAGNAEPNFRALYELALRCIPIAMVINIVVFLTLDTLRAPPQPMHQQAPSPFFERLPVALGRDIISIQSQDHYLRVVTTKGSDMILMRMADAVKQLEALDGVQTHRSWWVAKKHITDVVRDGGKVTVLLSDGEVVPVSRGRVKEL